MESIGKMNLETRNTTLLLKGKFWLKNKQTDQNVDGSFLLAQHFKEIDNAKLRISWERATGFN